ncbi:hypothetical protein STAQ_12010 [Allostella sp. ATCC 35155]|nr:hypothetical protein STAQ_12010 [Stella sp. ATCC 35155]
MDVDQLQHPRTRAQLRIVAGRSIALRHVRPYIPGGRPRTAGPAPDPPSQFNRFYATRLGGTTQGFSGCRRA